MIIHLFKGYGIIESEIVNVNDKTIEFTSPVFEVKINQNPFKADGKICNLPSSFEWGQGATPITVKDLDGNTISCGMITRYTSNDMKSMVNIREILIRLSERLCDGQNAIQKHSELIQECLDFCKYPDIFKKIN